MPTMQKYDKAETTQKLEYEVSGNYSTVGRTNPRYASEANVVY